ncbi:MAG: pyridoxamine 5'-phosphate oxidase family protein [Actinomycetota bacterium]|nr:pyridoxamine 5'-phosphate oxidase family protein [Actinomycetota bacterium]
MSPEIETSKPYRLRRNRETGVYDQERIYEFLDSGAIGTLGVIIDDKPVMIPTIYARVEDKIVIHGSKASAILRAAIENGYASLTTFVLDRIILPDSIFYHSVDYRSVSIAGRCYEVEDEDERSRLFRAFSDAILPNRYDSVREPNEQERRQTMVIVINIEEALYKFNETENEVIETNSETSTSIVKLEPRNYSQEVFNNDPLDRDVFAKFLR